MKLSVIARGILKEQSDNVIDLSDKNIYLTFDDQKKKIILVPQDDHKQSDIRNLTNLIKNNFRITKVNNLSDEDSRASSSGDTNLKNSFEIVVDPRENFDSVLDFIKNQ